MKKLYIFDMGGVVALNTNVFPDIADYLGFSKEEGFACVNDLVVPLMEGKIPAKEFWKIFSTRSHIDVNEELFEKFFHPQRNEPVYTLISELQAQHRVICGTNSIEEHYAIHRARGDYDVFGHVYASHRIGLAKPNAEFYRYILEHEKVSPSQTVFIDDAVSHIDAARELGIEAYHFTGYEALVGELRPI